MSGWMPMTTLAGSVSNNLVAPPEDLLEESDELIRELADEAATNAAAQAEALNQTISPTLDSGVPAGGFIEPLTAIDQSFTLMQIIASYVPIFIVAFLIAFAMTPIMRMIAIKYDIVDRPSEARKQHKDPVPYLGGVAIFLGWFCGASLAYFWISPHNDELAGIPPDRVFFQIEIVLGALAILITGVFDDIYGISPRVKIGGQLFAAAALASEQVGIRLVEHAVITFETFVVPIPLPDPIMGSIIYILGAVVIAVFIIGGCNAMNLLDGLDGLASGVAAIAMIGFLLIAAILALGQMNQYVAGETGVVSPADPLRLAMCMAVLGAILGFLPHNFNPATIFMGDAGSLLLGYFCVTTILLFGYTTDYGLLYVTACLIVFAVPITDTSLAIFRRKMAGKPLSAPDDQHIHHLLRRAGFGVKQTVLILYAIGATFMLFGVGMIYYDLEWRYLFAAAIVLYGFIFVYSYKMALNDTRRRNEQSSEQKDDEPKANEANEASDDSNQAAQPEA